MNVIPRQAIQLPDELAAIMFCGLREIPYSTGIIARSMML